MWFVVPIRSPIVLGTFYPIISCFQTITKHEILVIIKVEYNNNTNKQVMELSDTIENVYPDLYSRIATCPR